MLSLILLLLTLPFVFSRGQAEEKAVKDWTKGKGTLKIEANGWILKKFPVEASGKKFMADHPNVKVETSAMISHEAYMLNWSAGDVKGVYGFSWNFTNFGDQQLFFAINCLGGKAYNSDQSPNRRCRDPASLPGVGEKRLLRLCSLHLCAKGYQGQGSGMGLHERAGPGQGVL